MKNTLKRIKHPVALVRLGQALRLRREQLDMPQSKVDGMRQATVSKIENGGDVTLDTLISYASALGLEVTLAPIGQSQYLKPGPVPAPDEHAGSVPLDLLDEFDDLKDDA
ncbi:hypothetical protein C6P61_15370 [Malikia spinosa]|uniref:HTH cro/C1-type domain-containing protein n=1 Tax=Malikia spinosa TaxID=86180 RepID=A0A2S9KB19_9BURK|nr:helix-turn-helix transcriptional regulator [Malikia spinosa]PRD67653.1 hypothetical protein C6P61_15370 [Malikia spinosa]